MNYLRRLKKNNGIKRVCVIDSSQALLQYLLLSTKEDVLSTYFFWAKGVPEEVKEHFKGMYTNMPLINYRPIIKFLLYHIIAPILWPFLLRNDIEYWGFDHLHYSPALLRSHKLKLLEDGTLNYEILETKSGNVEMMKWLYGYYYVNSDVAGGEELCTNIYLTGLLNAPILNNSKVIVSTFENMWNKCNDEHKHFVLEVFGLNEEILSTLRSCKDLLLTEPYSEDFQLTEQEKIDYYKQVVSSIQSDRLLIKPHPRELTNYKKLFPQCVVLMLKVPMQLLTLCGVRFDIVYALESTAIYSFPYPIKFGFIKADNYPKMEKIVAYAREMYKKRHENLEMFELEIVH